MLPSYHQGGHSPDHEISDFSSRAGKDFFHILFIGMVNSRCFTLINKKPGSHCAFRIWHLMYCGCNTVNDSSISTCVSGCWTVRWHWFQFPWPLWNSRLFQVSGHPTIVPACTHDVCASRSNININSRKIMLAVRKTAEYITGRKTHEHSRADQVQEIWRVPG